MLRFLFRVCILMALLGAGAYYWTYGWNTRAVVRAAAGRIDGLISRERVHEAGDEIAQVVADRADHARAMLSDVRLTAKIKSKMALDDTIAARRLDVDSSGAVVTVRGTVDTDAQRQRALQLARETDGVTSVVDRIDVAGR
jgi:hyperosmotically inducible periplasmic protein